MTKQKAIKALKKLVEYNEKRSVDILDPKHPWSKGNSHFNELAQIISESWEKDAKYLKAVIRELEKKDTHR